MSPEHLYFHAVQRSGGGKADDGVSIVSGCEALKLDGQAVETGWPYLAAFPQDLTAWAPPASATPVFQRKTSASDLKLAEIFTLLDAGTPVVLILLLGKRFYEPVDGLVSLGPDDADVGYHAVIAVGHGRSSAGEDCILIRNSWGLDWALHGNAWITTSYLAARLRSTVVMDIGVGP